MATINTFFETLWKKYTSENPLALRVYESLIAEGENVINDHIALRTFNLEKCNIEKLSTFLVKNGYEEKEEYYFEEKKLHAKHFEHKSDKDSPLVFISELEVEKFSTEFQDVVTEIYNSVDWDNIDYDAILYSGIIWGELEYSKYEILKSESQYASWLYTNGYSANHFTVSVNKLQKYNSTKKITDFLLANDFDLNTSGGIVKGTPESLLEQLSTMADKKTITFKEGEYEVPTCFYEFAYRFRDVNEKEFRGFIANNADKIFESTDANN